MARSKHEVTLVTPRLSAEELQQVLLLSRSGASGYHGQGPRRERSRSATRKAAIRRASE